jgi:hypothetical protein
VKKRRKDDERQERHEGADLHGLVTEYHRACTNRDSNYWERQRVNYETRFCLWANQSWDGRKWKGTKGKKPFPWLGASDARVPLVDLFIQEDVALLMQAWREQRILARPTRPAQDAGWANNVTNLLRWLVYEEMEESEDEAQILANYYLERGAAALGVFWCRKEQLTRETVSLEDLTMAAANAGQPEFIAMLLDPTQEETAVGMIVSMLGEPMNMTTKRATKLVRDLRTAGVAQFPRPIVVQDRPKVRALRWNEDVIVPPECTDLQESRVVFIRELLTETALAERVRSYKYDPDWVDQVVNTQRGKMVFDPKDNLPANTSGLGCGDDDTSKLFEVATAYERKYDEDNIPGLYATAFSPGMKDEEENVASHELLDYAHGQFPIVDFALERRSRLIDDSRGYGERAHTEQRQIKRQRDARIDRADVATLPPSFHPPDEEPDAWGPGVKIGTRQRDSFGYFETPKYDAGSNEVENTVMEFVNRYFGRQGPNPTIEAGAMRAELVRGWLRGWKKAGTQILKLAQQYLPDEVFVRVVGGEQGRPFRLTREEIQGPFNLTLRFTPDELDKEYVKEKLALLQQALALDVSGRLDRDEVLSAALELVDPSYAERLIKPGDQASMEQIEDERSIIAKMLLGIGTDVRGDEAFGLRRQVIEATIAQSQTAQRLLQANPEAQELFKARVQQLDFNIQQKMVNPEIGRRLGSKPVGAKAAMGQG